LFCNTAGNDNVAIGEAVLYNNTASSNTGVGDCALLYNTTGSNNTSILVVLLVQMLYVASQQVQTM
jgi:hypothetical protein